MFRASGVLGQDVAFSFLDLGFAVLALKRNGLLPVPWTGT
jgi:hypothetical protein